MGKVLLGVNGFVAIGLLGGQLSVAFAFLRIFSAWRAAQNAAHVPTSCAGRHFNRFTRSLADAEF
jgi:hypothetical protein